MKKILVFMFITILLFTLLLSFTGQALAHPRCADLAGLSDLTGGQTDDVVNQVLGNGGHTEGLSLATDISPAISKCAE